jgi:two-component system sensor histidine kinase UhpB
MVVTDGDAFACRSESLGRRWFPRCGVHSGMRRAQQPESKQEDCAMETSMESGMRERTTNGGGQPASPGVQKAVRAAPRSAATAVGRDLATVLGVAALAYGLAGRIELGELFADWALGHEHWQADELPFTLIVLCGGLVWFGWRRERERAREQRRNQALARRLMQVQESERRHLARELHDEFGQHCAAMRFEAQCLQRLAAGEGAGLAPAALSAQAIAGSAEALQQGLRRLLRQLRPAALDTLGLDAALDELVRDWQAAHRIAVVREGRGAGPVGDRVGIAVFRIVQEALTNVARHARAAQVTFAVERGGNELRLEITDDGVGLGRAAPGCGLTGMQERAVDLGGEFAVEAPPGGGTRVSVRLPLPRRAGR